MEKTLKFNSQIATSLVQSERLLALGLKKETADCYYWQENDHIYIEATGVWHLEILNSEDAQEHFEYLDKYFGVCLAADEEHYFTPAWSLGILIKMLPNFIKLKEDLPTFQSYAYLKLSQEAVSYTWEDYDCCERQLVGFYGNGLFVALVDAIEWLIKEGYFNKEYLV